MLKQVQCACGNESLHCYDEGAKQWFIVRYSTLYKGEQFSEKSGNYWKSGNADLVKNIDCENILRIHHMLKNFDMVFGRVLHCPCISFFFNLSIFSFCMFLSVKNKMPVFWLYLKTPLGSIVCVAKVSETSDGICNIHCHSWVGFDFMKVWIRRPKCHANPAQGCEYAEPQRGRLSWPPRDEIPKGNVNHTIIQSLPFLSESNMKTM